MVFKTPRAEVRAYAWPAKTSDSGTPRPRRVPSDFRDRKSRVRAPLPFHFEAFKTPRKKRGLPTMKPIQAKQQLPPFLLVLLLPRRRRLLLPPRRLLPRRSRRRRRRERRLLRLHGRPGQWRRSAEPRSSSLRSRRMWTSFSRQRPSGRSCCSGEKAALLVVILILDLTKRLRSLLGLDRQVEPGVDNNSCQEPE